MLTIVSVAALSLTDLDAIASDLGRGLVGTFLALLTGLTLVLALRASGVARRWRRIAEVLVVLAFLTSAFALVLEQMADRDFEVWQTDRPSPLWVMIAVLSPLAVIRRLIMHRRVAAATMSGAIAAYLLIAIGFCYLYMYLDSVEDAAFFVDVSQPASNEFMYFSLVSITTVGYGDFAPAEPLGRLLATSEAVIGQVYLVTFVAMLVGLLIQQCDS